MRLFEMFTNQFLKVFTLVRLATDLTLLLSYQVLFLLLRLSSPDKYLRETTWKAKIIYSDLQFQFIFLGRVCQSRAGYNMVPRKLEEKMPTLASFSPSCFTWVPALWDGAVHICGRPPLPSNIVEMSIQRQAMGLSPVQSSQESRGRGRWISVSSKLTWSTQQVPGQPKLHREILSQKKRKNKH